jgi:hypothetical protein
MEQLIHGGTGVPIRQQFPTKSRIQMVERASLPVNQNASITRPKDPSKNAS